MAYDPVKAHEYYIKYRKKGLKKGRKRGSGSSGGSSRRSSSSSSSSGSSKEKKEPVPYTGYKAQTVIGAGATKKEGNKTVKVKKAKEETPETETKQEQQASARAERIAKANKSLVSTLKRLANNPNLKNATPEKMKKVQSLVEGIIAKLDKQNDGSIDMNTILALKNKILL